MSGAGQQIKDKPWLIPAIAGGTALTGGLLAPALAAGSGAAAAGAAAASGVGGGTAAGLMTAGAAPGLASSLLAPSITPAMTAGLGGLDMAAAGLGAGGSSMFGAGATASPLMLEAMSANPIAGGLPYGKFAGKLGQHLMSQQQGQQQPQGMGQTPMSMAASNQMPADKTPQFNPGYRPGQTIGGLELMKRRRGMA